MPARTRKIRHDDETRAKIQAAQIINRFQKCLDGEIELDAQQVSCGKALLNKVLPDVHYSETNNTHDISDPMKELVMYVAANGGRLVKTNDD